MLGFPLLFLLDRANIEAVIWVLILLGIVGFTRNRMLSPAVLLGLAASMKIFPGLLFLLFLAKRKYGAFALAIAATALFSILALAGIGPSIRQAAADSSKSAQFLKDNYINVRAVTQFDHSLFATVKQTLFLYHHRDLSQLKPEIAKTLAVYSFLIPLAFALIYWIRLRHLPVLNQLVSYLVLCVLLPYVSYEYTLVYIYIVWGAFLLFLLADVVERPSRNSRQSDHRIYDVVRSNLRPSHLHRAGAEPRNRRSNKNGFPGSYPLDSVEGTMPSSMFGELDPLKRM